MTEATQKNTIARDLPNGWRVHRLESGVWFVLEPNGRGYEVEGSLSGFFDAMFADSALAKGTDQDPEVLRQKLNAAESRIAALEARCGSQQTTINRLRDENRDREHRWKSMEPSPANWEGKDGWL